MKAYLGTRHRDYYPMTRDCTSVVVISGNKAVALESYSPVKTAFDICLDWGENHTGFGCTNLSASILADYLDLWKPENEKNRVLPQELIFGFRDAVVRKFSWNEWRIDEEDIADFLEEFIEAREEAIEAQIEASNNWEEEALNELVFPNNHPSGFSADFDEYRGANNG